MDRLAPLFMFHEFHIFIGHNCAVISKLYYWYACVPIESLSHGIMKNPVGYRHVNKVGRYCTLLFYVQFMWKHKWKCGSTNNLLVDVDVKVCSYVKGKYDDNSNHLPQMTEPNNFYLFIQVNGKKDRLISTHILEFIHMQIGKTCSKITKNKLDSFFACWCWMSTSQWMRTTLNHPTNKTTRKNCNLLYRVN